MRNAHAAWASSKQFSQKAEYRSKTSSILRRPSFFEENTRYIESRNGLYYNKLVI